MKILLSAYACEPGRGSEPGVGWNTAKALAQEHQVWVLTSRTHQEATDAELERRPQANLHVVYLDPLGWKLNWSRRFSSFAVYAHYYLWQVWAYFVAKSLHRRVGFDVAHHVTYIKYATPSFLALLPIPFFFGPVGGGESAPKAFTKDLNLRARIYELLRTVARNIGEWDPFVRLTVRRSAFVWAATEETCVRLRRLGARQVEVCTAVALDEHEAKTLGALSQPSSEQGMRFIAMGRLLHWKGFHLALRALARADLPGAELWILGDGPEDERLRALAADLGITNQVTFLGNVDRHTALARLGECDVLVHPSLHDSGGWVCLEAMAAGRPVIVLDLGGPALLVSKESGYRIEASSPAQAVQDIADAMTRLAGDEALCREMGREGQRRIHDTLSWDHQASRVEQRYEEYVGTAPGLAER